MPEADIKFYGPHGAPIPRDKLLNIIISKKGCGYFFIEMKLTYTYPAVNRKELMPPNSLFTSDVSRS